MKDKMKKGIKGNSFKKIGSKYILQKIFDNLTENKLLKIIKYNKSIQKELEKDINDYKNYKKIIIEIIPINKEEEKILINMKKKKSNIIIYILMMK